MDWIRKHKWWLFALIAVGAALTVFERRRVWREHSQDKHILAAAERYAVDPALIKAVVWRESRFNPRVRGRKGELGLMQIMKDTAEDWARAERRPFFLHAEVLDPALNTHVGAWYLNKLLRRYTHTDDPVVYALADYNAGRSNVLRWLKGAAATNSAAFLAQMDFPSTRAYVRAVRQRHTRYRAEFASKLGAHRPEFSPSSPFARQNLNRSGLGTQAVELRRPGGR